MPVALYALALGGFGIGLTEFVIMGLLPEVSTDFKVSETTAGYLISGYALAVAIGAIILTAVLGRLKRRGVLLVLLMLFIAGNLICAVAPTFEIMMFGRVVAAMCHGAFFGLGAVVAADLVAPARRGAAISLMFAGLTVANVAGVPLGTLLGQAAGWRSTFWAITAVGVLAFVGIRAFVPVMPTPAVSESITTQFRIFRSGQVWLSMLVTVLGYGGMFGAFTFIAFTLTDVSGFAPTDVPWLLVIFGVGLFVGNILGGRAADKKPALSLVVILSALTVVLAVFALTATSPIATIIALVLMGGFGFATVPLLQMRIMSFAGDGSALASGANIAAFNVGNAFGAWVAGLGLAAGLGYTSPLWLGAAITIAGLGVFLIATFVRGGEFSHPSSDTRTPSTPSTSTTPVASGAQH